MINLEEITERHKLHNRVTLLGSIAHDQVRNVLIQGDIFLNTSLTEAFCIAIVEAACCGLQVISTNVGGIPEVLPESMLILSEPSVSALLASVDLAIDRHQSGRRLSLHEMHNKVRNMYNWHDIAKRTNIVYNNVSDKTERSCIVEKILR
jgi:phosphatidylinositol glycan class A protein